MSGVLDQKPEQRQDPVAAMNQAQPRQRRERTTRTPTGLPSWPVVLVAGREKTGKSYQSAFASASDLIGATYWLGYGEKDPDEYGAISGARFEIAEHDGSLEDFYDAVRHYASQPRIDGKPNLLVLDSGTRIWDSIRDRATAEAVARKAFDKNGEPVVGMDLWNKATGRWNKILEAARMNDGPVIITARLDTVTVLDDKGKPTKAKTDKIKGQRNLGYDVDAIVEMPERGRAVLSGARSVLYQLSSSVDIDWFDKEGMDGLWRRLGLDKVNLAAPTYTEPPNPEEI